MRSVTKRIEALERGKGFSTLGDWLDSIDGDPPAKPMHPELKAALDALPDPDARDEA